MAVPAGRYLPEYHKVKGSRDFFECCRDPEVASTLTLQPVERYAGLLDAAIIFSDILVIPQAMGMLVEMVDKKGPHFPSPLKSPDHPQYKAVMERSVNVTDELNYVYQGINLARKKLAGRVPLIGFCGAPWTLFSYMVEGGGTKLFVQSRTWVYQHPKETEDLLHKIADICVNHLAHQVKAGAQMVMIFDSWVGELSPASYRKFSEPYLARIAQELPGRLRDMGIEQVPMAVFPKGAWYALDSMCDLGYNVVGIDWLHDPASAAKVRGARNVVLQGNADPGILYGTKESITETVQEMVRGFWLEKRGWIANLGHGKHRAFIPSHQEKVDHESDIGLGITPSADPENLKHFLKEIHRLTKD